MTVKELLRELQKEKYDTKNTPVYVVINGKRRDVTSVGSTGSGRVGAVLVEAGEESNPQTVDADIIENVDPERVGDE